MVADGLVGSLGYFSLPWDNSAWDPTLGQLGEDTTVSDSLFNFDHILSTPSFLSTDRSCSNAGTYNLGAQVEKTVAKDLPR